MTRFSFPRVWLFLRRLRIVDRIALAILVLYAISRLVLFTGHELPLNDLTAILGVFAIIYFLFRIAPWVRNQLLWRLRNRLIVAYIFIAVVPVILLLAMFALAANILYLELGAHILHDDLNERISVISAETDTIAEAIAETTAGKNKPSGEEAILKSPAVASAINAARSMWPEMKVSIGRGERLLKSGNGRHFSGLAEHEKKLWLAAADSRQSSSGSINVLVAVPMTASILDDLPPDFGPIHLILLDQAREGEKEGFEFRGKNFVDVQHVASKQRALYPAANWLDMRVNGASILEVARVESDATMAPPHVVASFSLRPSGLNERLLTSLGAVGPVLFTALVIVGIFFLVIELGALVTGVVLTRTITRAVGELYEATLHVRRGDFSYRVPVKKRDQLGALGESFNEMTLAVRDLIDEQRRRQRLENELAIAREVQEQLFPHSLPALPGLELAAICRAARAVSGDYYDFIELGHSRLGIALADISGKGISAALLMASLQAALHSQASLDGHGGTAKLVERINVHLFKNTSEDRYATFFYGVYDAAARTLTYTNAGHLAPFYVDKKGVERLDVGGTVVGLFEGVQFEEKTIHLDPGSLLVAFSDGLTEPENAYGEEFGAQRLQAEILRQENIHAQALAENLIGAAGQWSGSAEQADDMTVVVARMT